MIEPVQQFSINKHVEKRNSEEIPKRNMFVVECPLKFCVPENGMECIGENCGWWMPIQRACAVNVSARSYGYIKEQNIQNKPYTK